MARIIVIGATGRTGRRVVALLCARGHAVTALGRTAAKLGALDRRAAAQALDVTVPGALAPWLGSAGMNMQVDVIVSCAHARFTSAILDALPDRPVRLVLMGSVRRYLPIPDRDGSEIAEGERLLYASGRPCVMLHASMIFGAPDDGNVSRILGSLARWPKFLPIALPLPDGGRRLVQPIFIDDVAASVVAAVERPASGGPPLVLAGPTPIAYRRMIELCAVALGRRAMVLPVPLGLLAAVAAMAARAGIALPLNAAELRRAAQDKSFDVEPMVTRLGVTPIGFDAGLARMIGQAGPP